MVTYTLNELRKIKWISESSFMGPILSTFAEYTFEGGIEGSEDGCSDNTKEEEEGCTMCAEYTSEGGSEGSYTGAECIFEECSEDTIELPDDIKLIGDLIKDESLLDVLKAKFFFGGEPKNFLEYVRPKTLTEYEDILDNFHGVYERAEIILLADFSYERDNALCYWAARNGHLRFLKWAFENNYLHGTVTTIRAAIENDQLECLIYLYENALNTVPDIYDAYFAISNNSLRSLIYICTKLNKNSTLYLSQVAAENGSLECLIYVHENGNEVTFDTFCGAIKYGRIDCLKYLYENGCPYRMDSIDTAVDYNQLKCVIYLRDKGFPWNEGTSTIAAMNGNLKMLMYLHENGCPWNESTILGASLSDSNDCLLYAVKNGLSLDVLAGLGDYPF